jgi:hypothetical protein
MAKQQLDRNPFRIDCYHFSGLENQMSGALGSIFGGGSGGIFGSLLNIASMVFPPLAIANSLSNLLVSALGTAIKGAVDTLVKEFGMPKFIGDGVKGMLDTVLPQHQKESDPQVDAQVGANKDVQDWMKQFISDSSTKLVEDTRKYAEKKKSENGGKMSAGSWLQAIAEAMGEIMGSKAADMVGLSKEMAKLNTDGKSIGKDDTQGQKDNAQQFSMVQAKFQAASQEYGILSNTFSNAIKSIGEGLTAMGRKG